MLSLRTAVLAAVSAVVVSAAFAAPPPASPASKRELRAATVDELPPEAKAALAAPRRPATSTPEAAAQQAHIDPRTGTLIEAPPDAVAAASGAGEAAPQVDMSLQRFPNGFLYIDTSGYQHSAIATIGADGSVHLQCEEPGHGHDAPAEEPQP